MRLCRFMLLLCMLTGSIAYADDDVTWLNNQVDLGFYNHTVLDANFNGPANFSSPGSSSSTALKTPLDGEIGFYQHLIYHSAKHFSINWGVSAARWTYQGLPVLTASGFVDFNYWPIRTQTVNPYLTASIAGPSLVSRQKIGDANLGAPLIFQNFLGVGVQIGKTHVFDIAAAVMHYSNGGTFPVNDGFNVPLVLMVGYSF